MPPLMDGSIIDSPIIFRALEKSKGVKPLMLVAYDSDGREAGHILIAKRRNIHIFPPAISHWCSILGEGSYSDSCTNREEIFKLFLEKTFTLFDFKHTYIEVQNIEDSRFAYGALRSYNFVPMRDQRLYISLHSKAPQERLSRAYRAHIRKAEERGVTCRRATNESEIDEGLTLLRNYYMTKTRRKLPSSRVLKELLHEENGKLSEKVKLFVVTYKNRIIGSSLCLYDKYRANLAYSCGLRKRYPLQFPGIMAIWAALSDAYEKGFAHFEFLEARDLSRLHSNFLSTLLNYGGKQVGTLQWCRFRWNWVNKFLRAIYV